MGCGNAEAEDPIERVCRRPDFLVPVYAVTNGGLWGYNADEYTPADVRVNESTPPTFLVHTHEDVKHGQMITVDGDAGTVELLS